MDVPTKLFLNFYVAKFLDILKQNCSFHVFINMKARSTYVYNNFKRISIG